MEQRASEQEGGHASLMARAKSGDRAAFGELYQTFFTPVYRYVLARVGNPATAADIVQTTFLKTLRSIGRFEERGHSPVVYLLTVARNTIVDHWRERRDVPLDEPGADGGVPHDIPDDRTDSASGLDQTLLGSHLRTALLLLSADQRDVISLRFFGGQSTAEIASVLGKTPDTIRQLQSRGLRALRELLRNEPWLEGTGGL